MSRGLVDGGNCLGLDCIALFKTILTRSLGGYAALTGGDLKHLFGL